MLPAWVANISYLAIAKAGNDCLVEIALGKMQALEFLAYNLIQLLVRQRHNTGIGNIFLELVFSNLEPGLFEFHSGVGVEKYYRCFTKSLTAYNPHLRSTLVDSQIKTIAIIKPLVVVCCLDSANFCFSQLAHQIHP